MTVSSQVLLIEDDPGDIRLAMAVLRKLRMEHRAMIVHDGQEAMDYLQSQGKYSQRGRELPALILLDLKMPRVNGFELLQRIKSEAALKYLPVVILTSSQQDRDVELAYALGVNGYVVKSIDFTSYVSALRSVAIYWLSANTPPPPVTQCRMLSPRDSAAKCITSRPRGSFWGRARTFLSAMIWGSSSRRIRNEAYT